MANNAAMQGVQSNISAVSNKTIDLCAALVATQQQLANLMAGHGTASQGWPSMDYLNITQRPQPGVFHRFGQHPTQPSILPPTQHAQYAAPAYKNPSYT